MEAKLKSIVQKQTKSKYLAGARVSYIMQLRRELGANDETLAFLNDTKEVMKLVHNSENIGTRKLASHRRGRQSRS